MARRSAFHREAEDADEQTIAQIITELTAKVVATHPAGPWRHDWHGKVPGREHDEKATRNSSSLKDNPCCSRPLCSVSRQALEVLHCKHKELGLGVQNKTSDQPSLSRLSAVVASCFATRTPNERVPLSVLGLVSRCDSSSRGNSVSNHVNCCRCGMKSVPCMLLW